MKKSESKKVQLCSNPGADVDARLGRFFRSVHPSKTVDRVAEDMGVSRGTAKNWVEGKSTPNFFQAMRLIGVYGPEFLVAFWPNAPRWMQEAYTRHQIEQVKADQAANARRLEALNERI